MLYSLRMIADPGSAHPRPRLVCIDIDGTLLDGIVGPPFAGAVAAVERLRERFPVRFVTNAGSIPRSTIAGHLASVGFADADATLFTPIDAAREVLCARGQAYGMLLAEDPTREDFAWFREQADGGVVLLADECHRRSIADLQPAFRRLLDGAPLYSLTGNRYFRHAGQLVTDLGPVAAFLSFASGRQPEILGKPSPLLFDGIAGRCAVARRDILMIGDDAEFDASGSVRIGMTGMLVRTGKYRPGDESRTDPPPTAVLESIADLPRYLFRADR